MSDSKWEMLAEAFFAIAAWVCLIVAFGACGAVGLMFIRGTIISEIRKGKD